MPFIVTILYFIYVPIMFIFLYFEYQGKNVCKGAILVSNNGKVLRMYYIFLWKKICVDSKVVRQLIKFQGNKLLIQHTKFFEMKTVPVLIPFMENW